MRTGGAALPSRRSGRRPPRSPTRASRPAWDDPARGSPPRGCPGRSTASTRLPRARRPIRGKGVPKPPETRRHSLPSRTHDRSPKDTLMLEGQAACCQWGPSRSTFSFCEVHRRSGTLSCSAICSAAPNKRRVASYRASGGSLRCRFNQSLRPRRGSAPRRQSTDVLITKPPFILHPFAPRPTLEASPCLLDRLSPERF